MLEFAAAHQQALMLVLLGLAFVLLGWWESAKPFVVRPFDQHLAQRQTNNILLLVLNTMFLYGVQLFVLWQLAVLQLGGVVDVAALPLAFAAAAGVLLLDLGSYLRHRLMHGRWFWLVHRVHHSDADMDWTTEFRFHPIEALISLFVQSCVVLAFGLPVEAIALYALVAMTVGCWQHANVAMPNRLDRALCQVLVTPDFHRLHHQRDAQMQAANYGVVFSWWDQLLGTRLSMKSGRRFGLEDIAANDVRELRQLLRLPFKVSK